MKVPQKYLNALSHFKDTLMFIEGLKGPPERDRVKLLVFITGHESMFLRKSKIH